MTSAHDSADAKDQTTASVSPEAVLEQLQTIRSSEMFSGASRLVDLLEYIVKENLKDPSRKILAKTIAEEIYGRAPDKDNDSQNIVRVDAGRLRRRLAEFYAGPGRDNPILIHVDPGAYVPRFETNQRAQNAEFTPSELGASTHGAWKRPFTTVVAVFVALFIGFGLGVAFFPGDQTLKPSDLQVEYSGDPKLEAERRARLAKSPSSLQAVTMSDQARNLIFPFVETQQVELSLAMFRQAIKKDSLYFGGYAGASQSLAALAIYLPEGEKKSALLEESRDMVDQAEALSPANSWTQSALSWVFFVEGQTEQAIEHANIAIDLAPTDGNVLDFYAVLMLSAGNFTAAQEASDNNRKRTSGLGRFANKSLFGASSYHLGQYQDSIDALTAATISGDPISAPTLAYLAASHHRLGNAFKSKRHVVELTENWPDFDPQTVLSRLYLNPDQVTDLTRALEESGWSAPTPSNPTTSLED
ncbi:tetratricopeptide repeat protein [Shimia abyssi]|uniref:Tetratricopeptide repeat protein n=1 Tax=Shimia abyssi TaxID=1662395 RepID=A0A2P8FCZ0_9RHOB|nr:hypothetical protein [Shimia abyssi]PSL19589.1 hypothetical protein CLV88_10511 [Shimia abyssi]